MKISNLFSNGLKKHKSSNNHTNTTLEKQYSLHQGDEIYNLIVKKIEEAQTSVFVAASWFTDHNLFDALLKKYDEGSAIDIRIILDNNKDNFYLPFKKLVDKSAKVKLVKKASSYGRMHNKFCIIDEQKLISGSYNWSKNARTNNDENIIYTEDQQTVAEFLDKFNALYEESINFDPDNLNKIEEEVDDSSPLYLTENNISEYEKLITELIYAQVHSYDDNQLHTLGKERSTNCSGDAKNLQQELDNVYSSFLRDIKISNDKKELIKSSLQEQLERSKGNVALKAQNDIDLLEKESNIKKTAIENEVNNIKSEIVSTEAEINNLKADEASLEKKIKQSENNTNEIKNDNYRPEIPLYTFIPNLIFLALVVIYSIVFYSSATYILIFAEDDAKQEKLNGGMASSPEIFNGNAITNAFENGFINLLFILLVPFFIMGLIFIISKIKKKWLRYLSLVSSILFIDGFTAYKVAESIHRVEYLRGKIDESWSFHMVWNNTDFYLVLVFGLLALITFEALLSHLFKILDDRNEDIKYHRTKLQLEQQEVFTTNLRDQLRVVNIQTILKSSEIKNSEEDINSLNRKTPSYEIEIERQKHSIQNNYKHQKSVFENINNINLTKIENENFTFSSVYIHDRISIFMRGWKDFLHEQFAVNIALTKSREADEEIGLWKSNNIKNLAQNSL